MSIYKLLLLRWSATLSLLFFLFVSCADRLDYESVAGEEPNVYVTLDLSMPGSGLPKTRMDAKDQDALKDLRVLVFDKDDKFRYNASVTELNASKVTVRLIASTTAEEYKLVLLANVPSDLDIKPVADELRTSLLNNSVFTCTDKWDDSKPLPMWGETKLSVVNGSTVFVDQAGAGAIQMHRALARVDVGLNFAEPNNPTVNTAKGLDVGDFKLKSVRVYNSMNGGRIFGNPTALTTPSTPQTPNLPSSVGPNATNPLQYDLKDAETNANAYCGNIFLPEAEAGAQAGDPKANFLVVGGYYGEGNTAIETFYRVDFIDGSNKTLALLRNNLYRVNITKVSNAGYATADEAMRSTPANMTASVVAWNNSALTDIVFNGPNFFSCASKKVVLPYKSSGEVGIEVASSVPASAWTITSSSPKVTVIKPADDALQGTLKFVAAGRGGIDGDGLRDEEATVTVTVMNLEMTFVVRQAQTAGASANIPGVPNIGTGGGGEVQVPGQGELGVGAIRLSGANCFIANKVGTYVLDASIKGTGVQAKINPDVVGLFPPNPEDVKVKGGKSADVLWETFNTTTVPSKGDVVKDVSYDPEAQHIIFSTTENEGNAVIAVRDGAGTILWSWHIWRVNFNPEDTKRPMKPTLYDTKGVLVMMDRNLGALSAIRMDILSSGLLYQWGRKDPMPGTCDNKPFTTSMATTVPGLPLSSGASPMPADYIEQSIQAPKTFMQYWTSPSGDLWGTPLTTRTSGDVYAFNQNPGAKTIYDPCPPGWRVPPAYTFFPVLGNTPDFLIGDSGHEVSKIFIGFSTSWFSGSGYRGASGKIDGTSARLWTSSPTFIGNQLEEATCLRLPNSDGKKVDIGYESRVYGHNCRCIKELENL